MIDGDTEGNDYITASSGDKWYVKTPALAGRMNDVNVMTSQSGITAYAASRITHDPDSAFKLVFDQNMIATVLFETNRQGEKTITTGKNLQWMSLKHTWAFAY